MKVRYKEEPRAWRKSTLLTLLGLALVGTVFRWRHMLDNGRWLAALAVLGCTALVACSRPAWFRGYYRFSTWAGFWSSLAVARAALAFIFLFLITPAALILRILGKDPLQLKRPGQASSYWKPAKPTGPLDRSF